MDWLSFGLPYEGSAVLAGSALAKDVPTCPLGARLGEVRGELEGSRFGILVVVNGHGIVLGRLNRSALEHDDDAPVDRLMREGPTTVRPSEEVDALRHRMHHAGVGVVLVTRSDGRLLGAVEHGGQGEAG